MVVPARQILAETIINVNQAGYLTEDTKVAIISSDEPLDSALFRVLAPDGGAAFQGFLLRDLGPYLRFPHNYHADFSPLQTSGRYRLQIGLLASPEFSVGENAYRSLPDSLLRFFRLQRCGDSDPLLHSPCHPKDASAVQFGNGRREGGVDLTGGWHDAGDYVKFTVTTAYSSYLLLLTAEYFPRFEQKLLAEARIGLDWLLKMHPAPDRLFTQVADASDHIPDWRLPEHDPLASKRLAYSFPSQAQAGIAAAAFAIASTAYDRSGDSCYSERCLTASLSLYRLAYSGRIPAGDCPVDSHYCDREARDNLALAAVELFVATREESYLDSGKAILERLGAGGWVSWGDLEGFACGRIAPYWSRGFEMLQATLESFEERAAKNPYFYPAKEYIWGSLAFQIGVADLALIYERVSGEKRFRPLAERQRDFLFGANPFGVSFVARVGSDWPARFHHQISSIRGIQLPGAVAGGPVPQKAFTKSRIRLEAPDRFASLQSAGAVYHDDRMDFLCNEPTIAGNAGAILLIAWFAELGR